ncbi:rCG51044 [Rattus norvegicus]|uniref:RCG51044 n=1 Tax=Rattus norvegicus TaxID=10116 RepID=A6IZ04_RAT|nr:rCG51044 [Rattus norvegicus]
MQVLPQKRKETLLQLWKMTMKETKRKKIRRKRKQKKMIKKKRRRKAQANPLLKLSRKLWLSSERRRRDRRERRRKGLSGLKN